MQRMLVSRISRRVLAEHHIALSEIHAGSRPSAQPSADPHVGIIFTGLNVKRSVDSCARLLQERPVDIDVDSIPEAVDSGWPTVSVDGCLDTTFSYIREHLEYAFCHSLASLDCPQIHHL